MVAFEEKLCILLNMLLIETFLAESPIAGIGLFAGQRVEKGQVLWRFVPGFDNLMTVEFVKGLPDMNQEFIRDNASLIPQMGAYLMCGDNDRFTNHSNDPNRQFVYESPTDIYEVATREINPGDELTNDYSEFDDNFADYAADFR